MATKIYFLMAIFTIWPFTSQFEIKEDTNSNGLILYPYGEINIYEKSKELTYALDLSRHS